MKLVSEFLNKCSAMFKHENAMLWIWDVYPGSRILIFSHPRSRISDPGSWISDPGSKNRKKERGEKKLVVIPFYVVTNFTKL
jgi:hypothetical protein